MANLQIYPFPMVQSCNTHLCYGRSVFIIARKDVDYGTAAATGTRICLDCAKELVGNIPSELLESADLDVEARIRAEERIAVTQELDEQYKLELHKSNAMFETLNAQMIELKEQMAEASGDDEDEDVPAFGDSGIEDSPVLEETADDVLFRCLDCGKDFGSSRALNGHISAKHK